MYFFSKWSCIPFSCWYSMELLKITLFLMCQFSSVQSLSHVRLFATPWIAARQASLSITNSRSSLKLSSIESVMPSSHLILGRPLLLLPPIPPSIRVFSNESTLRTRWPKYWSFSFSIIPSKEHPGLISFRMDWLDLLAVHGTLKSLLQHHSSKASVLQCSTFSDSPTITSIHDHRKNHSLDWKWSRSVVSDCLRWTVAYQAPPSMGFSRQECWSGLPFPSDGPLLAN